VINFGLLAQDSIPVSYRINGGVPVTDTLFASLAPGDSVSFSFPTLADLSATGNYIFDAWTSLGTDSVGTNDSTFNYSVDNIPEIHDVGAVGFFSPQSGFGLSNSESVNVLIRNFGNVSQSNIPVAYTMNGGAPVNDTLFGTITAGGTASLTFSAPVDLSTVGSFTFEAWTSLVTDTFGANDSTLNNIIEHYGSPQPATFMKAYGSATTDVGLYAQQTSDGGIIAVGQAFGSFNYDFYAVRTDVNGDTLWTKRYDGMAHDYARSVQQTSDGGFVISGTTAGFGAGSWDVFLIKTDANGDTLWSKTYGGTGTDEGYSVQQTADGGYIMAGYTTSFGSGGSDIYVIKTDANGDTLWTKVYGGTNSDRAKFVRQTDDGGYVITGYTYSSGAGSGDVFLIKNRWSRRHALDTDLWWKQYR